MFRVIDHELLMQKLMHGIKIAWLAVYLHGHTQSVALNDGSGRRVLSRPLTDTMGVFQGSALGPLFGHRAPGPALTARRRGSRPPKRKRRNDGMSTCFASKAVALDSGHDCDALEPSQFRAMSDAQNAKRNTSRHVSSDDTAC